MEQTVLLVDDNIKVRKALALQLQMLGVYIEQAGDGLSALTYARKRSFAAVVIDQRMPIMDGMTLAKNIRRLPAYSNTPILLLSTDSHCEYDRQIVDGVLSKPINGDLLLETIKQCHRSMAA
ncbi:MULTISPECIES: response regulator [Corallincola]|uniref:Response regulator n=3 Tax=Corallincola TaxID=1775176 RepID=A0A368NG30_9GAMM|nr:MULTISPECIES: response regulator [Corallincola]RCU49418.1 response regulator [Corallincola holothuriorum]TAA47706.1 response regulator [Corallincola spongiicola]TCI01540.1 response regulator [Corallincola luteus]